jgi:hypothetical protein
MNIATVNVFGRPHEESPTGIIILKSGNKTVGIARLIDGTATFKLNYDIDISTLTAYYAGDKKYAAAKSLPISF